jgi:hypothetical protein
MITSCIDGILIGQWKFKATFIWAQTFDHMIYAHTIFKKKLSHQFISI